MKKERKRPRRNMGTSVVRGLTDISTISVRDYGGTIVYRRSEWNPNLFDKMISWAKSKIGIMSTERFAPFPVSGIVFPMRVVRVKAAEAISKGAAIAVLRKGAVEAKSRKLRAVGIAAGDSEGGTVEVKLFRREPGRKRR